MWWRSDWDFQPENILREKKEIFTLIWNTFTLNKYQVKLKNNKSKLIENWVNKK